MTKPRPSRTATKIARFMVMVDAIPRLQPLLPAGAAETIEAVMLASGAVRPSHLTMMRRPQTHRFMSWAERLTGRGQVAWFGVRKR